MEDGIEEEVLEGELGARSQSTKSNRRRCRRLAAFADLQSTWSRDRFSWLLKLSPQQRTRAAKLENQERAAPECRTKYAARSVPHAREKIETSRVARPGKEHEAFHSRIEEQLSCKLGWLSKLLRGLKFRGRVIAVVLVLELLARSHAFCPEGDTRKQ